MLQAQAEVPEKEGLRQVVELHLAAYPEMTPADLYKLAHQAAMGIGHALPDRASAGAWLDRELAGLSGPPDGPLCMPLSPDGELVRVDLRVFRALDGDREGLLDAMVETAERYLGSVARLELYLVSIEDLAAAGELPFGRGDLSELFGEAREEGYPALRHSETYRRLYKPAYRVLLRELVELATANGCRRDSRSG